MDDINTLIFVSVISGSKVLMATLETCEKIRSSVMIVKVITMLIS